MCFSVFPSCGQARVPGLQYGGFLYGQDTTCAASVNLLCQPQPLGCDRSSFVIWQIDKSQNLAAFHTAGGGHDCHLILACGGPSQPAVPASGLDRGHYGNVLWLASEKQLVR